MKLAKVCLHLICSFMGISIGFAFSVYRADDSNGALQEYGSETNFLLDRDGTHLEWGICVLKQCLHLAQPHFEECYRKCDASQEYIPKIKPVSYGDISNLGSAATVSPVRRQIDPLQSCIEAKCANAYGDHYAGCVYKNCIVGFRLGKYFRRHIDKQPNTLADNAFTQYTLEKHNIKRVVSHHKVDQENDTMPETVIEQRREYKRSWNDLAGTCVQFHCPGLAAGSIEYNVCAQMHCSRRR